MGKTFIYVTLLAFLMPALMPVNTSAVFAQEIENQQNLPYIQLSAVAWNVRTGPDRHDNLQVFVELSASQLLSQRADDSSKFNYRMKVDIFDEYGDCIATKFLRDTLDSDLVDPGEDSEWTRLYNLGFHLPAGRYQLEASVVDLNNQNYANGIYDFAINDLQAHAFNISDILLARKNSILVDGLTQNAVLPFPTAVYGINEDLLVLYFEIYKNAETAEALFYHIAYRQSGGEEHLIHSGKFDRQLERIPVMHSIKTADMTPGEYKIVVRLFTESKLITFEQESPFVVFQSPTDLRFRDYREVLQEIAFLAHDSTVQALKAVEAASRQAAINKFWRELDPTPGTISNELKAEFYRRVYFALDHFPGRVEREFSDQARVFIMLGAPDALQSTLDTASGNLLEIWQYDLPVREIVFRDHSGFGDFRLVTPLTEIDR